MNKNTILSQYDDSLGLNKELTLALNSLIPVLLKSSGISVHSVTSRIKERNSLSKKIEKKDKYTSLNQITDTIGVRIISHYSDEVDKIAKIIEEEFKIDTENSIDKRATLDPDKFGYLSLHYVAQLTDKRLELAEYRRFKDKKFEIQIRSILQHTWAEIEHDIGYKNTAEVPKELRRQFSRLAGLLEIADEEFVQIRNKINDYERSVKEIITKEPESVLIDAVTIYEFINSAPIVKDIDKLISEKCNFILKPVTEKNASRHIKYLNSFGVKTISDLIGLLNENKQNIMLRSNSIEGNGDTVSEGISIFYLHQVLAAKIYDSEQLVEFLNKHSLGEADNRSDFATYLTSLAKTFV